MDLKQYTHKRNWFQEISKLTGKLVGLNFDAHFLSEILIHTEPLKINSEKNSQGREIITFKSTLLSFEYLRVDENIAGGGCNHLVTGTYGI
jgi:hypothetical protein